MKIPVTVEVEAPDDATHYFGDLLDDPIFVKCTQVGVGGDHWWHFKDGTWFMISHHRPHWLKELPSSSQDAK